MTTAHLLGRAIYGGYFIYNGINHLRNRTALAQYAAAKKVPLPDLAVAASGALLLAGGASILTGYKPKAGAAALVAFLAGVSPVMHDFWTAENEQQGQNDFIHFGKNMALLGSALAILGVEEPWPASLEPRPTIVDKVRELIPV